MPYLKAIPPRTMRGAKWDRRLGQSAGYSKTGRSGSGLGRSKNDRREFGFELQVISGPNGLPNHRTELAAVLRREALNKDGAEQITARRSGCIACPRQTLTENGWGTLGVLTDQSESSRLGKKVSDNPTGGRQGPTWAADCRAALPSVMLNRRLKAFWQAINVGAPFPGWDFQGSRRGSGLR